MRLVRALLIGTLFFLLPALFLWNLTFAGRIMVGGDPLNFFYPYHDGVAAALSEGRLPHWNPYLFGGVPFLADSQAQLFYPFAWLFFALPAPTALTWSVVLHMGIAGVGTYAWARRGLGLGAPGAWAAGILFALGGYLGAQMEHVNQVAAASWMPLMLLGYQLATDAATRAGRARGLLLGALAIGLSLLAGHAQSTFIALVALGLWVLVRGASVQRLPWLLKVGLPLLVIVAVGALLAAVQLVPTQMLSGLSTRAGGLEFREAVAFSFDPRIALRAFLPTFGADDPLLSEYVGWLGFGGLALAGIGAWFGRGAARAYGLLSAITGALLSLGVYNPLFWLLWWVVPGFDLFRVPARWLLLWAFGAALLAGIGIELLRGALSAPDSAERRPLSRAGLATLALFAGLAGVALFIFGDMPARAVLPWWAGAAGVTLLLMAAGWLARRRGATPTIQRALTLLWLGWIVVELWLGARGLEYQHATAPEAYAGMRTTVAHLSTQQGDPGGGRVLSKSDLTWDPGDLARLQERYAGQLSDEAIYDLVVATKLKEILAPNQPMRWRIPSADGYGGGLLPSARWVEFQALLPLAKIVPDGRLREQLTELPAPQWLDVLGVEWLIADKVNDWWSEGIYHDLGAPRMLQAAETLVWQPQAGDTFMPADTLSFVVHGQLPPDAGVISIGGRNYPLTGAGERAARPVTTNGGDSDSDSDARELSERHYTLDLGEFISEARTLELRVGKGEWTLGGITLWNSEARGFEAYAADPALRATLSGDVKVYHRDNYAGRAWFVPAARFVPDSEMAATWLMREDFDPRQVAVVEQQRDVFEIFGGEGTVRWVREGAGRIELEVESGGGGWLLLADAPSPGWRVTIDGAAAEWLPANLINRVVRVPAGTHTVVWEYATPGLQAGATGSAFGLLALAAIVLWGTRRAHSP